MNELSSIAPAAHHSALFLIQAGICAFPDTGGVTVPDEPGPISIIAEPIPAYFGS
jgi:hypothetical protein